MPVKGQAAAETKAAFDQARLLIEQAEALGERPDDPLLLFSVLYGFYVASWSAFDSEAVRGLAAKFFALAEQHGTTVPLMVGHRQMGAALSYTGEIARGRAHFDQALILYNPAEHRGLVTRFGSDVRVTSLFQRSLSLWLLGHPDAALIDAADALSDARETGHAASVTYALLFTWFTQIFCGNYSAAAAQADEIVTLANAKGSELWNACGVVVQGCLAALTGRASDAVQIITSGLSALQSTGLTLWISRFGYHTWHERMQTSANSGMLGAASAKQWQPSKRPGRNLVRGGASSHGRGNRGAVARAGRGEGASIFRACARGCA